MKEQEPSDQARKLLQRYVNGNCTPAEEQQVLRWFYSLGETDPETLTHQEEEALTRLLHARLEYELFEISEQPTSPMFKIRRWLIAASVLAICALSFWMYTHRQTSIEIKRELAAEVPSDLAKYKNDILPGSHYAKLTYADGKTYVRRDSMFYKHVPQTTNEVQGNVLVDVPKAGTYQLVLEDGTKVWLNASTQFSYPEQFTSDHRTVTLHGEAYFEVAKDTNRPFRITTNGTTIEVLGTSFNVASYHDQVSTTLVEGSVKVRKGIRQDILLPGQEARVIGDRIAVKETNVPKNIAWQRGEFYFDGTNLPEIIEQISRWYDVDFANTANIQNLSTYKGSISRQAKLSSVLNILEIVTGRSFSIQGRKIYVS
ncbi:FecR domain-containing protein [Sphingobacterium suaedae]|uniref:FecR domain-containing protein n=1 Tax=Sphingobacterium suaedae TaxID=1686402 RepID=A0ABW5KJA5_9SPHI